MESEIKGEGEKWEEGMGRKGAGDVSLRCVCVYENESYCYEFNFRCEVGRPVSM